MRIHPYDKDNPVLQPMTKRQRHMLVCRFLDGRIDYGNQRIVDGLVRRGLVTTDRKRLTPEGCAVAVNLLAMAQLHPGVLDLHMADIRTSLEHFQRQDAQKRGRKYAP